MQNTSFIKKLVLIFLFLTIPIVKAETPIAISYGNEFWVKNNKTWNEIKNIPNLPAGYSLTSLSCTPTDCRITGAYFSRDYYPRDPFILTSNDNGKNWTKVNTLPDLQTENAVFYSISCSNKNCVVSGRTFIKNEKAFIIATQNNGETWHRIDPPFSGYLGVAKCNGNECVINAGDKFCDADQCFTNKPAFLVSHNGGQSWAFSENISGLPKAEGGFEITALNFKEDTIIAGGRYLTIPAGENFYVSKPFFLVSKDQGMTWQKASNTQDNTPTTNNRINSIDCNMHICAAVGDYNNHPSIYVSFDKGESWTYITNISGKPTDQYRSVLNSISCDDSHCYAVGMDYSNGNNPLFIINDPQHIYWWFINNNLHIPFKYASLDLIKCKNNSCLAAGHRTDNISPFFLTKDKTTNSKWEIQSLEQVGTIREIDVAGG